MVKSRKKTEEIINEIDRIHGLVEIDNDALDNHLPDYCEPMLQQMRQHVEDKIKHLKEYAVYLQKLNCDDAGIAICDGMHDELNAIKQELTESLDGILRFEGEPTLDTRGNLNHFFKQGGIVLLDMINRLQRIQKVLHTSLLAVKITHGS
jgi:hypothetical protein